MLFVALPLILIMVYAFQDGSGNFTFGNFTKFFKDADAIGTFALSLEVAIETTAVCILLGYPAAWILANRKLNKSAVTIVLFIVPVNRFEYSFVENPVQLPRTLLSVNENTAMKTIGA